MLILAKIKKLHPKYTKFESKFIFTNFYNFQKIFIKKNIKIASEYLISNKNKFKRSLRVNFSAKTKKMNF